jgi:predicted ATP-grasp superfamily ATP-dependent carboligase
MNVIILDGQLKSALCAVRSLGQKGVEMLVGAERETGMALHSRYVQERFVYPSPYTNQTEFVHCIIEAAKRLGGKPVVFAFSDATYLSLYTFREELSLYVTLVFPDSMQVEIAFDKAATYSLARVSGIPTIKTYSVETSEEISRLSETVAYPVVIKTRRSVTWRNGVGTFGSASFIHTKEQLQNTFLTLKEKLGEAPLIQDLLLGEEYGVEMLVHKGKVFALVTHHRIRSLSPTGGASVLKETVEEGDLRHTLETYAEKLVKSLEWSGPIMVEFKVDSDSREPKLMEINGRFWGSLPLSVAAGVDMPYLYYEYATRGMVPASVLVGKESVVTRHFLGDVRHLFRVFFARDRMRKILYPRRMHALRDFFALPKGTKSDVWSLHEPKPALFEIIDILKKLWS